MHPLLHTQTLVYFSYQVICISGAHRLPPPLHTHVHTHTHMPPPTQTETHTHAHSYTQILVYFSYQVIFISGLFFAMGAIGFLSSGTFVYAIMRAVKAE